MRTTSQQVITVSVVVCQVLKHNRMEYGLMHAVAFCAVPFCSEILKFCISWQLLQRQRVTNPEAARITKDWRTVALFPIPSLLYMVHNNVQFYFLK